MVTLHAEVRVLLVPHVPRALLVLAVVLLYSYTVIHMAGEIRAKVVYRSNLPNLWEIVEKLYTARFPAKPVYTG